MSLAKKVGFILLVVLLVGWATTYSSPVSKVFGINKH